MEEKFEVYPFFNSSLKCINWTGWFNMAFANQIGAYEDAIHFRDMHCSSYEALAHKYGDLDNYSLVRRLGSGKYSEVFEGIDLRDNERVAIKVLKPVCKRKIGREVKILEALRGGVNIVTLKEVVSNPVTLNTTIIMEFVHETDFSDIYLQLSDYYVRYYTYELLKALEYCHSHGIMHRDVKPYNIVVNHKSEKLRLVDFGLADFYRPGQQYSLHVASRHYKGPELLVGYDSYDYSLDMWSTGCVLASMVFRIDPFFNGKNDSDQLVRIASILGTEDFFKWINESKIEFKPVFPTDFIYGPRREWKYLVDSGNKDLTKEDALDLLDRALVYNPERRIAASDAMKHAYFAPVREDKRTSSERG